MSGNDDYSSDTEELTQSINAALLCDRSFMAVAVSKLVKALRFKFALEVGGRGNPGYDEYIQIANRLGVRVLENEYPMIMAVNALNWASDHSTKNLRAWIPDIEHRLGDLHVWFPFCFEHHLRRLRKQAPDFPMPKVDSLYLLLIWRECFEGKTCPISARVLQDLLASETFGEISACRYSGTLKDEAQIVNRRASTLNEVAQMYLGFLRGADGSRKSRKASLEKHPFNSETRNILKAMSPTISGQAAAPPWLVRRYQWDADKTAVILKNSWMLHLGLSTVANSPEARTIVISCLTFRLEGLSEDEIAAQMEFTNRSDYDQWLVEHCLDTDGSRCRPLYDDWIGACSEFGLDPSDSLVDSLTACRRSLGGDKGKATSARADSGAKAERSETDDPIPGFRHSLDFRSLHLPTDRALTLTARQSEVVKMLFLSLMNDTPEISQAFIIDEVYSGVSETRLKRLFGDHETYDLLIEAGSKRGLVKLRTKFK